MKKGLTVFLALAAALALFCCAACAEENPLNGLLQRITDPENPIAYTIATPEYDVMEPVEGFSPDFAAALQPAVLSPADPAETPDGEYVVLNFPSENVRYDFFLGDAERNYIRRVDADGSAGLFTASLPEGTDETVSMIMMAAADSLAEAHGLQPAAGTELPEDSWVRESVNGVIWVDDRASLEVFPEGDGYKVLIFWGSSAWETAEWVYGCEYDPETDSLKAAHVICDNVVYGEGGEESRTTVLASECEAVFSLNEQGKLVITNAGDEQLEGKTFEVMPLTSEAPDTLHADIQYVTDSPEWVAALPAAKDAAQLFVVAGIGMDKTTASVSMHEKDENGVWKQILSTPGFVGKNGLCADADHAEGCAQTPVGTYHFNKAFGIAPDPGCAIPYVQVDDNTYWSGDPDRQYNQMVDIRDVPDLVMDDSEHIVDYEYQYQYCLNISFNEDGTPGRGSAIFLHCLGPAKPWTGGCVAIPENIMKLVMRYVREDCVVVIDTLENMNGTL